MLVDAENAVEFLSGLSKLAAAAVSKAAGDTVECAVTVKLRRKPATAAASSQRAVELDQVEQAFGDGPCITALQEMSPVILNDVTSDPRWPELNRQFAERGVYSAGRSPRDQRRRQCGTEFLCIQTCRVHPGCL